MNVVRRSEDAPFDTLERLLSGFDMKRIFNKVSDPGMALCLTPRATLSAELLVPLRPL